MSSPSWRGVVDYSTNTGAFVFGQPRVWADTRMLNLGSPPVSVVDLSPDGRRLAVILYADGSAEPKHPPRPAQLQIPPSPPEEKKNPASYSLWQYPKCPRL